jgi:hypothetical protein
MPVVDVKARMRESKSILRGGSRIWARYSNLEGTLDLTTVMDTTIFDNM